MSIEKTELDEIKAVALKKKEQIFEEREQLKKEEEEVNKKLKAMDVKLKSVEQILAVAEGKELLQASPFKNNTTRAQILEFFKEKNETNDKSTNSKEIKKILGKRYGKKTSTRNVSTYLTNLKNENKIINLGRNVWTLNVPASDKEKEASI